MDKCDYSQINDKELVALLLERDEKAWEYTLLEIVAPLCHTRKYLEMYTKYGISAQSIITQVWMLLEKDDFHRLRIFRFGASLKTYLFIIVREAMRKEIHEKIGNNPYVLSENDDFCSQIASRPDSNSLELKEDRSLASEILAELWRENPMQAWVLLLRNSLQLSAKEVALFLNESSSNVDQMNKRAKSKMRELRRQYQ